jgi:archaellum biogenesis protein FlaJ (TadC family)
MNKIRNIMLGIIFGILVIGISLIFVFVPSLKNMELFYFLVGIGILVSLLPLVISSMVDTKRQREKNKMFLEFTRSLVESVESGTPISKSILNLKPENFGALGKHIGKLQNQIRLGIPLQKSLDTFAQDTKSKAIIRAVTLIREADKTGGNIEQILNSVSKSVSEIENLKAERRSAISSIVMEGYIIFFIFIIIMIVVEIQIIPLATSFQGFGGSFDFQNVESLENEQENQQVSDFSIAFLSLLITQGLFAGLVIGKLAEGSIKSGIKHSFILAAMAILISTGSKLVFM